MINEISKIRFDAFIYCRSPGIHQMSREIMWFEAYNLKYLAVISEDVLDNDFGFAIFARNSSQVFTLIDVGPTFYRTRLGAKRVLFKTLRLKSVEGVPFEANMSKGNTFDVFESVVEKTNQHRYFAALVTEPRFEAARNLIREILYSYIDVDGNYLQQFQSDGFDARLWELFLYVYFYNAQFLVDRSFAAPDYALIKNESKYYVEAVTVGKNDDIDFKDIINTKAVIDLSKDYLPIKFGSALFSKISRPKQYWELEHVRGRPFVLAIHDYHLSAGNDSSGSMTWSRAGLVNYLYGVRDEVVLDVNGRPVSIFELTDGEMRVKMTETKFHEYGKKKIPSNFFSQPNSENVSAVLFSNGATIATFNRMGKLAGMGSEQFSMIRMGVSSSSGDNVPGSSFTIDIDSLDYKEAWGDTIVMYHNPHALQPVNPFDFEDISHVMRDAKTGEFFSISNPNEVISSVTLVSKK